MQFLSSRQIQVFHHVELLEREEDEKLSKAWWTWSGISFNENDLNYFIFIFYLLFSEWNVNTDCAPYLEKK